LVFIPLAIIGTVFTNENTKILGRQHYQVKIFKGVMFRHENEELGQVVGKLPIDFDIIENVLITVGLSYMSVLPIFHISKQVYNGTV